MTFSMRNDHPADTIVLINIVTLSPLSPERAIDFHAEFCGILALKLFNIFLFSRN